jgi:uncharacterized SAM-binding protein YcdF (DUF218 family)
MPPLSVRLALSRFLNPGLLLVVALGVALFFAFREPPGREPAVERRSRRRARAAAWLVWATLWAASTPVVGDALLSAVEVRGPDLDVALASVDPSKVAIVVLGGGVRSYGPTPTPRERLSGASTQRTLTAARVWHDRHAGLVSLSSFPIETEGMADLLGALGVPADRVVQERRSQNTRDNAAYSAEIVRERGMQAVVVVTSAYHLRRSLKDFAAVGIHALPVEAEVLGPIPLGIDSFLPSAQALERTHTALHEILGYVRG